MIGQFPELRLRRKRQSAWLRDLVAETRLSPKDLVWPVFVHGQEGVDTIPIPQMPGVDRLSIPKLVELAKQARDWGIPMLAIFPYNDSSVKTEDALEAVNPDSLICRAIAAVKKEVPEIGIMSDVALDLYTTHGHDGLFKNGEVVNDETNALLARQALIQAQAGADVVAPSDMMDGRVAAIRTLLDKEGYDKTLILAYTAKYHSSFYGPYRHAVGSINCLGKADKKTYQLDYMNSKEAMSELYQDLAEGADMVMVKPGIPYLDILQRFTQTVHVPVFLFQITGEYAMVQAAAKEGWLDAEAAYLEMVTAGKRAGAAGILTYAVPYIINQLQKA